MSTSAEITLKQAAGAGQGVANSYQSSYPWDPYCKRDQGSVRKGWPLKCPSGYWASYKACNKNTFNFDVPGCELPATPSEYPTLVRVAMSMPPYGAVTHTLTNITATSNTFEVDARELNKDGTVVANNYVRVYKLGEILCDHNELTQFPAYDRVYLQDQVVANVGLLYRTYVGSETKTDSELTHLQRFMRSEVFWKVIFPEYCFREVLPSSATIARSRAQSPSVIPESSTYTYFDYERYAKNPNSLCNGWKNSIDPIARDPYMARRQAVCTRNSQLLLWPGCDGACLFGSNGNVCTEFYQSRCRELWASAANRELTVDEKDMCACYNSDSFNLNFFTDLRNRLGESLAAMIQNVPECVQPSCAASKYKRNNVTCQDITSCFATINFTAKGNITTAGDINFANNVKCDSYKSQVVDNGAPIADNKEVPKPPPTTTEDGFAKTDFYAIAGLGLGGLLVLIILFLCLRRKDGRESTNVTDGNKHQQTLHRRRSSSRED